MSPTAHVLHDGLRLSLLRRPLHVPLEAGFGSFLVASLLLLGVDAATTWFATEPPRVFDVNGLMPHMIDAFLAIAMAALMCAVSSRRALLWPVAGWYAAAMLLPSLIAGVLYAQPNKSWEFWLTLLIVLIAWDFAILWRLALYLSPRPRWRSPLVALLGLAITFSPLAMNPPELFVTDYTEQAEAYEDWVEPGTIDDAEATIYAQPERLQAALDALAPQRPGHVDLYALAFGGDAGEDVFRNEVEHFERLFAQRFDATGRTLGLLNHPQTAAEKPLATATNLERALLGVASRMDVEEDVLLLYLTSHGSEDHWFYVNQPPLPLDQIDPERLRAALDGAGIRWRVLVVSACYSGGFLDALRDDRTLVLTAARADRASFGCGADSDITYFGRAFLAQALNETDDFVEAFERAKKAIAARERREEHEPSEPQIAVGKEIGAKLEAWRAGFEPGPAVKFAPAPRDP